MSHFCIFKDRCTEVKTKTIPLELNKLISSKVLKKPKQVKKIRLWKMNVSLVDSYKGVRVKTGKR